MYQYGSCGSWYDLGWDLPLHLELGTRDQANIVHLDEFEEVVWVGTQRGRLLSYTRNDTWAAYSRFNVSSKEERVIQILSKPEGVVSLTRSEIAFHSHGGVAHPLVSSKALARMTNNNSALSALESFPHHMGQLAVGSGDTKTLFYIDSIKGELAIFFDLPHTVSKIHACVENPLLAVGGANGSLSLVEGRVPKVIATVNAHPMEVTSIASNQQYIYTCGKRRSPQLSGPDVFLKMFDVRNLKQSLPVSIPNGAIRVETRAGWSVLVLSSYGVWQQADLFPSASALRNSEFFQTNCFAPHSPDVSPEVVDWSPRAEVNAMLDSAGVVHFWSCAPGVPRIAPLSQSVLVPPVCQAPSFPHPVHAGNAATAFDDMPTRVYSDAVREGIWADEGDEFFNEPTPLRPPLTILPQIREGLKPWNETLAVTPTPAGLTYGTLAALARGLNSPKKREPETERHRWRATQIDYSINHSLFPFAMYNKTQRSGLESGVANSAVQVLYALPAVRQASISHACEEELCVQCELGSLFASMDAARFSRSKICQSVRLCRVMHKLGIDFASLVKSVTREHSEVLVLEKPSSVLPETVHQGKVFKLHSVIVNVAGAHHVAVVAVPDDLNTAARGRSFSTVSAAVIQPEKDEWVLFNDFVVTPSSLEEAIERSPTIAVYVSETEHFGEGKTPYNIDQFCQDRNLGDSTEKTFVPLRPDELEKLVKGELIVALDTEFVSIGLAAMEIREDGSREIGRPGDMTVGRVSVLRVSEGDELDGVPFIDHYIAMDETDIKDYVTRFSGIRAGDLDPLTSPHWLTSSKTMHQKLRFMLDCGTKFVGHGLHTDFRILNLWAPQSALIDTVDMFHLRGQRFLSLKFLANRLIDKSIQGDVHCSIEDAKTALDIYRVYLKLEKEGTVETTIKSLYDSGRTLGWK